MNTDERIITPPAPLVKPEIAKKHLRIVRKLLKSQDITEPLKALWHHIAKCQRKRHLRLAKVERVKKS